jgi:hypothetical protein
MEMVFMHDRYDHHGEKLIAIIIEADEVGVLEEKDGVDAK